MTKMSLPVPTILSHLKMEMHLLGDDAWKWWKCKKNYWYFFLLLKSIYHSIIGNIFGLQSSGKLPKNEGPQNVKETTSEVKKPDGGKYSWFSLFEKYHHLVYNFQVSMLEACY